MFLNKLEQARQENRVAFLASQSAEFDREILELTLAGIMEITKHFEAYKKSKEMVRTDDLEALARTLERLQKVGKLIFGEVTENSDLHLYVGAREKLLRKLDELANKQEPEADVRESI